MRTIERTGDFIGTTISGMTGRGSIRHNNRSFTAANVDRSRTGQNVTFCNEDLKQVYHEIFDEALAAYNAKKKKTRDKIPDYYEHIRQSKQESEDRQPERLRVRFPWRGTGGGSSQRICGVLPGTQSPSAGVQYGAAHGRGNAPPPCRLRAGGHGAEPGPVYQGFHETGIKAAGL